VFLSSTLMLVGVSIEDEAIYQCVAENSVGSNLASAPLAVTGGPEPPPAPRSLQAMALSTSALRVSWEPTPSSRDIIGYVLHLWAVWQVGVGGWVGKNLNQNLGQEPGLPGSSLPLLNW
jgi:hypothetical protein